MKRFLGVMAATFLVSGAGGIARADDAEVKTILDKGIKALGGEEKLGKLNAYTWKAKGTITFNDTDNDIKLQGTMRGLDHFRGEFEGEFGGNQVKGVTVVSGDKGWRKFGDNAMEMDADAVANEKRNLYLQAVPLKLLPLKTKDFKVETAGEEKVNDKPANVLKVTPPDGKEFKLYLDKESGLPVRSVAKVIGFQGEENTHETTLGEFKEFDGVKKATKIVTKRDGQKFLQIEISEFKGLEKVDSSTFEEPK